MKTHSQRYLQRCRAACCTTRWTRRPQGAARARVVNHGATTGGSCGQGGGQGCSGFDLRACARQLVQAMCRAHGADTA